MAEMKVTVKISDLDLFEKLISYLKDVILHDERIPGDLANEMQEKIGEIVEECRER